MSIKVSEKSAVLDCYAEAAWEAWTTEEGLKSFVVRGAKVQGWVGGAYELYFGTDGEPGLQGSDGCKVLAFDPPSMLSFSWNAPPTFPTLRHQRTLVSIKFRETSPDRTEIEILQAGWGEGPEWDRLFAYFDDAWSSVLEACVLRFKEGSRIWAEDTIRTKRQFLYKIRPSRATFIQDATPEERSKVGEHFEYLKQFLKQDRLILAGRTQEDVPEGLVVFEAEDDASARHIMENDPAVKAGIFVAELYPFGVALSR